MIELMCVVGALLTGAVAVLLYQQRALVGISEDWSFYEPDKKRDGD